MGRVPDWPVPGAAATTLPLTPRRQPDAAATASAGWEAPPHRRSGTARIVRRRCVDGATVLAAAVQSPHRLIYQTPPLSAPVHVSGIPDVSLRLVVQHARRDRDGDARSTTKPPARRSSSRAAGPTRRIGSPSNGRSPSCRNARTRSRSSSSRTTTFFRLARASDSCVLSSDELFTLRPPAGTRLTLQPAEHALALPIVGGARGRLPRRVSSKLRGLGASQARRSGSDGLRGIGEPRTLLAAATGRRRPPCRPCLGARQQPAG